jgi:hypothetical protein
MKVSCHIPQRKQHADLLDVATDTQAAYILLALQRVFA